VGRGAEGSNAALCGALARPETKPGGRCLVQKADFSVSF